MAMTTGTVSKLTVLGNQCIVVLRDGAGHDQPPQALMTSRDNYNTMVSTLFLAANNNCQIQLETDNSGVVWLGVTM